jgi:hypothetical protein
MGFLNFKKVLKKGAKRRIFALLAVKMIKKAL